MKPNIEKIEWLSMRLETAEEKALKKRIRHFCLDSGQNLREFILTAVTNHLEQSTGTVNED